MTERTEVKFHELTVDETLRCRALDLACMSARDTIRFGKDIEFDDCTRELLRRADAFWAYMAEAKVPAEHQGADDV